MATKHYWLNDEKSVYVIEFDGEWTWTEYQATTDEAHSTIEEVSHDTNLIVVFRSEIPRGNPLAPLRRSGSSQPKNVRHTAFVTEGSNLVQAMTNALTQAQRWVGPKFVKSIGAALEHFDALAEDEASNGAS